MGREKKIHKISLGTDTWQGAAMPLGAKPNPVTINMSEGAVAFCTRGTYEVAVVQKGAEVNEDVLWGAVEEPRVGLARESRRLCTSQHHDAEGGGTMAERCRGGAARLVQPVHRRYSRALS